MQSKISKRSIDRLQPGSMLADNEVKGFVARRLHTGTVTYGLRYRVHGKQRWLALGLHGRITPDKARRLAKMHAGEVADRRDPVREQNSERARAKAISTNTVNGLLDAFCDRHVRRNLRSAHEVERVFAKYIRPRIGSTSIYELRRQDVVRMLDDIDDVHGPVIADRSLAHLRKAFNWMAARDDAFVPPIVRGMARTRPKERARERVLSDNELRVIWRAAEDWGSPYSYLIRYILLTATRLREAAHMQREELAGQDWVIPAARYKAKKDFVLPLSQAAQEMLAQISHLKVDGGRPRTSKRDWVFTISSMAPINGFSKFKKQLDARVLVSLREENPAATPFPRWVTHDLRRTARTLMSRAGVHEDHAERAIGHIIPGIRHIYDRHAFEAEKRVAFAKLGGQLASILGKPLTTS